MRKTTIILSVLALIASSCGHATKKQTETTNEITRELIENSFVVSCGSGCAMRYTAENITQNGDSINVAFKVEIFVDEKLTDTDTENYIFTYKGNEIQKIELAGESENLLETFPPDAYLFFKEFAVNLIKNNPIVEEGTTENEVQYLHSAEIFLKQLMNGEKLQLFFCDNWTFIYHEDNRCDGSTDGEKANLSPFEIDGIIKLKVKNDGDGWACEKKEPTEFYLDFKLKERVENWSRFEIPNYENQGKDGIIHIVGGGESDYIVLHYDNNNLIVKMEYRSEDPG